MKFTIHLMYVLGVATEAVSGRSLFTRSDSPMMDFAAQLAGMKPNNRNAETKHDFRLDELKTNRECTSQ
jgi:hypothetical protein